MFYVQGILVAIACILIADVATQIWNYWELHPSKLKAEKYNRKALLAHYM